VIEGLEHVYLEETWELSDPLLRLEGQGARFKLSDAFQGVQVFGATGSGKTSGPGRIFAEEFFASGFGGLVLCAKKEEAKVWEDLAEKTGRSKSLIKFSPDSGLSFNPLRFEQGAIENNSIINLAEVLQLCAAGLDGDDSPSGFWKKTLEQLFFHSLKLIVASGEELSFQFLMTVLRELVHAETADYSLSGSLIPRLISIGQRRGFNLNTTSDFFLIEFPSINDKTRSSITTSATSTIEMMTHEPFSYLLGDDGISITPEWIMSGAVIVIDCPVHVHAKVGRLINLLWKYAFQRACERRKNKIRPVFLWADESHYFATAFDTEFQSTARSSRCATVYLTQNIPLYRSAFSGLRGSAHDRVMGLLGNLHTKIFCKNSDIETNQLAARIVHLKNTQAGANFFSQMFSENSQYRQKPPERFTAEEDFQTLKSGSSENRYKIEAYVHSPSKSQRAFKTNFSQRDKTRRKALVDHDFEKLIHFLEQYQRKCST
jgi:hypothetical protein